MHPARRFVALAVFSALVLLAAACAADTPAGTTAPTTTMATQDDGHDHQDDLPPAEWDGGPPPVLSVSVTGNETDGWDVTASVEGFTFAEVSATEHRPGYGHTHVLVDGRVIAMAYEPVFHIDSLEPGTHEITVVLSRSDHRDYMIDGKVISSSVQLEVAGEIAPADVVVDVSLAGGDVSVTPPGRVRADRGDVVEIRVSADVDEELHIHGYDIMGEVAAGEPATIRFVADLTGIYDIEFEDSGLSAFALEVR